MNQLEFIFKFSISEGVRDFSTSTVNIRVLSALFIIDIIRIHFFIIAIKIAASAIRLIYEIFQKELGMIGISFKICEFIRLQKLPKHDYHFKYDYSNVI